MKRGFTLIEMVVVLLVLAIVTHLALRELSRLRDHDLGEAADRQLESLRDCIFAYDREGMPNGFLADMGRLVCVTGEVGALSELWRLPAGAKPYAVRPAAGANVVANLRGNSSFTNASVRVPTGWRGPYLRLPLGKTELLDPWGNPIALRDSAGFARVFTNESRAVAVAHYGPTALARERRMLSLVPSGGATSTLVVNLLSAGGNTPGGTGGMVAWYGPADGMVTGAVAAVSCPGQVCFEGLTPGVRVLRETLTGSVRCVVVRPGGNVVDVKLP